MKPAFRTLLLMLLLTPLATSGGATEAFFGEVVDVRVVNLEVQVERAGEKVKGLKAADFRLKVDGSPVAIDYFSEIDRVPTGASSAPATPEEGVSYLVFLDEYFAIPTRRNQALRALAEDLEVLRPLDRVALVAFDGRRLELLSGWSSSMVEIRKALTLAEKRPAFGLQRRSQFGRSSLGEVGGTSGSGRSFTGIGFSGARGGTLDVGAAAEVYEQVGRVAGAASATLRGFAGAPGRRVLLYYSGGLPTQAGDLLIQRADSIQALEQEARLEAARVFAILIQTANRLGYTVFTCDLGATANAMAANASAGSLAQVVWSREAEDRREQVSDESLSTLARATGGEHFFGVGRHDLLRRASMVLESFYWIGFQPAWKGQGRDHKLEIEVVGKGFKVRSRPEFADLPDSALVDLQVEGAHLFDLELPSAAPLEVEVGKSHPESLKRMVVPLQLAMPMSPFTWIADPTGKSEQAFVELRIAATDDRGDRAELLPQKITLSRSLEPETASADQVVKKALHQLELHLRRRPHRLLIAIYDPLSQSLLTQRVDIKL